LRHSMKWIFCKKKCISTTPFSTSIHNLSSCRLHIYVYVHMCMFLSLRPNQYLGSDTRLSFGSFQSNPNHT
jgi:hypothetical protein